MHSLLVFGLAVLALGRLVGPAMAEPLREELSGLLATHPEVGAGEQTVAATHAGVRQAEAGYLPRLDIYGESGPQYIDSPVLKSQGGGTWVSVAEVMGARLSQTLFDGYATSSDLRRARLEQEVAEYDLVGTRQNVLMKGIESYVEVLRQARLVALARENEGTIMRQLHLEDERVLRGAGIAVDVLQAKARLQLAKERRIGFEGGLADASARYVLVFGHSPELSSMSDPDPPEALMPSDLAAALALAHQENPSIDSSLATVAVAEEERRRARSDYYPNVALVASASRQNDNDLVQGTRTDLSVVVSARWNLFSGFSTDAGVSQAAHRFAAAQRTNDGVAREVEQQTRLAWNERTTAGARVTLLDNAVAIASEVFEARQKLREAGRETVINVLDAEGEVYDARINLVQARGDFRLASYRLLRGMGRLGPAELGLSQ